jgi:hypothetical protein
MSRNSLIALAAARILESHSRSVRFAKKVS